MLDNEATKNKTFALAGNYLGRKYMAHAGVISNTISHEENGGVQDGFWVRDTTVEAREISVVLNSASNSIKKRTAFLDQQYRIPLNFIKDIFTPKDTSQTEASADTLVRDVTTAFFGHSSEWNWYGRNYIDAFSPTGYVDKLFHGTYKYSQSASKDFFRATQLDNKLFMKLQPWSEDAIVSKLNVGVGDRYDTWLEQQDSLKGRSVHKENSIYAYAGVEGNLHEYFDWNARGKFVFAGEDLGDFELGADARLNLFPFRRARKSPLSLTAGFSTSLDNPEYYRKHLYSNHASWSQSLDKVSETRFKAGLDIPYWKLSADVNYALVGNHTYYDTAAVSRQYAGLISVLSASVRKEFVLGDFLHLDNRVLLQTSSNQAVLPLPLLSLNLKWFAEFVVQRNEAKEKVMTMQIGLNGWYNTQWYAPAWNPAISAFHNQTSVLYENGPIVDVFMNIQWKRACIFLKLENANMGWPLKDSDYFTAHNFINTQRTLKVGIFWPFYVQPKKGFSAGGGKGESGLSAPVGGGPTSRSGGANARQATLK